MSAQYGQITAFSELIDSRYNPKLFLARQWLEEELVTFRDSPTRCQLIIIGTPGWGKSALVAYLANKWNCPRYFIRSDSIKGVLDTGVKTFMISLGAQLYEKYGAEIFSHPAVVETHVEAKDVTNSQIVGRFIDTIYTLPFLSYSPHIVKVKAENIRDHSRVIGERIEKLASVAEAMSEADLLQVAVIKPLKRLAELHPDEHVVIFVDAMDEYTQSGGRIIDWIPNAGDSGFPPNLRMIMTSRPGDHLIRFKDAERLDATITESHQWMLAQEDTLAYIRREMDKGHLAQVVTEWTVAEVTEYETLVQQKSENNFLYLFHYFNTIEETAGDPRVIGFPQGLTEIYRFFAIEKIRRELATGSDRGSGIWEEKYVPLLGVLAVARESLSRTQLSILAGVKRVYVDTLLSHLKQFLVCTDDQDVDYWKVYHSSFGEYLLDEKQNRDCSVSSGVDELIDRCWNWVSIPDPATRNYIFRQALNHMIFRDRQAGPPNQQALDFCRTDNSAFLRQAVLHVEQRLLQEQLEAVFSVYFQSRQWSQAAQVLLYVRLLRQGPTPVEVGARLLTDPLPEVQMQSILHALDQIPSESVQRALALLSLARLNTEGDEQDESALLQWLINKHTGKLTNETDELDCDAMVAVLYCGPLDLNFKLLAEPMFEDDGVQSRARLSIWRRDPSGMLRTWLRDMLEQAAAGQSEIPMRLASAIVGTAVMNNDREIFLAWSKWIGSHSEAAPIEEFDTDEWLKWDRPTLIESLRNLCQNPRLRAYVSVRSAVCTFILLGKEVHSKAELMELARSLAEVAHVDLVQVAFDLAKYSELAMHLWSASPAELVNWLTTRVSFIVDILKTVPGIPSGRIATTIGPFVDVMCRVVRWVAVQSNTKPEEKRLISESMIVISHLIWRDPQKWDTPVLGSEYSELIAPDLLDPLRAYSLSLACEWLNSQLEITIELPFNRAVLWNSALRQLVGILFKEASPEYAARISESLSIAVRAPRLLEDDDLRGSLWIDVLATVAESIDVRWQPGWALSISNHHDLFPNRFATYIKKIRSRLCKTKHRYGWYPELLQIGKNFAILQGKPHLESDELADWLAPALISMEPELVRDMPNHEAWPPALIPLRFAKMVPSQFANTVAALEMTKRGMLWQIGRDLCQGERDQVWWDSVRKFRDEIRRVSRSAQVSRVALGHHKTGEEVAEYAMTQVNLILDGLTDLDQLEALDEVNINSNSAFLRLKEVIGLGLKSQDEILEWTVQKFLKIREDLMRWLLEPLVLNQRWDLLHRLIVHRYAKRPIVNLVNGFPNPRLVERPVPAISWRERMTHLFGIPLEEGLVYRTVELAKKHLAGELFDKAMRDLRDKISFVGNWQIEVVAIFGEKGIIHREIVGHLLVVSLLSGNKEPALIAAQLASSKDLHKDDDIQTTLLWSGYALKALELLTDKRILRVARSMGDLEILALLDRWDAVRVHLESSAEFAQNPKNRKALAQWYRRAMPLDTTRQLRCLNLYNELALPILAAFEENRAVGERTGHAGLLPVQSIATSFNFDGWSLADHLAHIIRLGDAELAREYWRAVLIEAAYGPDRKLVLDRLYPVCKCAGEWLTIEHDETLQTEWRKFVRDLAKQYDSRLPWSYLFDGIGECIGDELQGYEQWVVAEEYNARLAFAFSLAEYANLEYAKSFWLNSLHNQSAWLALRAGEAFVLGAQKNGLAGVTISQELFSLAWERAQNLPECSDPRFLRQIALYAVSTKHTELLQILYDANRKKLPVTAAVARIVLDKFFQLISNRRHDKSINPPGPWTLDDLVYSPEIRNFVSALIEEASSRQTLAENIDTFDHEWYSDNNRRGLGWVKTIIQLARDERSEQVLAWISTWISAVNPIHDKDWKLCEEITHFYSYDSKLMDGIVKQDMATAFSKQFDNIVHFAVNSVKHPNGKWEQRFHLALRLIETHLFTDEILQMLDDVMDHQFADSNNDYYLGRIAIKLEEVFPHSGRSAKYLAKMAFTAEKVLAEDKIAELCDVPAEERLTRLARAPRVDAVMERTGRIGLQILTHAAELGHTKLGTATPLLINLSAWNSRVDEHLAKHIGELLSRDELSELHNLHRVIQSHPFNFAREG